MSLKNAISQISIPSYSRNQERFNTISHLLGLPFALAIFVMAVVLLINQKINGFYFIGLAIFSTSAFLVYAISSWYHFLDKEHKHKKLFRIIDHCTIYLLIAGTYTPICFVIMNEHIIGLVMLIIEWVSALIGIVLNGFFFRYKMARIISLILYILMGWLVLYTGGFIYMEKMCFLFVLLGGITYTIGSLLYTIGHKNTAFHCVFHVFVILSTVLQTIGIFVLFF